MEKRRREEKWFGRQKRGKVIVNQLEECGFVRPPVCVLQCVYVLMPSLQTTLWKIIARGVSFVVAALGKETKEG